jgi:serine O-acetyltransferase
MDFEKLNRLAAAFKAELEGKAEDQGPGCLRLPDRAAIERICSDYVKGLFGLFHHYSTNGGEHFIEDKARIYLRDVQQVLLEQICRAVRLERATGGEPLDEGLESGAKQKVDAVFEQMPDLARLLASDVDAAFANDPAARGYEEVLLTYPGIEAITVQRLAHRFYCLDTPIVPRIMTEMVHSHTGIDIHPGASIGESFFIDHGTGVVIGETATIGVKVTLYHGVTLGAFNPLVKDEHARVRRGHQNKRHPDLEDHVTVYPNATILGGDTRVGHHSTIGGNVWLTHSVPPYSRVILKEPGLFVHDKKMRSLGIAENI